ncbi:GGDEF domain-containing protein [Marinibactrum halimedae]|uniref:GGDEF domain-containing protein n=1 Tax=Marinibactrum halimedae TaxID=1444977 RepID=A0AA37T8T8_9GAMM|nr:GGDEF domain-containing protein [Marinibactrum halimedae]MCD9459583.1 GGDEF domain-containing protein [Marinibactrum halimedae]GLS25600.1 hypothetical protein GCM10007877_13140 [Marinibactrum halimedae]
MQPSVPEHTKPSHLKSSLPLTSRKVGASTPSLITTLERHYGPDAGKVLDQFIVKSLDGYAFYDTNDTLVFCNPAFAHVFKKPQNTTVGLTFSELMRASFLDEHGLKLDNLSVDEWLEFSHKSRRSRPFRWYELQFKDDRCYLVSEQTHADGCVLIQLKDISQHKNREKHMGYELRKLSQLSMVDDLTRLPNINAFSTDVEAELNRCTRAKVPACLALFELNDFSRIVDKHGRGGGDAVLVLIGQLLQDHIRPYDILARVGDTRFGLFLAEVDLPLGRVIVARLQHALDQETLVSHTDRVQFGVSSGIADGGVNSTFESLFGNALNDIKKAQASHGREIGYHDAMASYYRPLF